MAGKGTNLIYMTAIIMIMVILKRDEDLKNLGKLGSWVYICGRRKTGKTFLVKNFMKYDAYYFVGRDGMIFTEDGRKISYETFFELFRENIGKKKMVIDEMHRLPDEFMDYLHSLGKKGELIAISSTLWLSERLLGSGSPLLGLFSMYILGLVNECDTLNSLEGVNASEMIKSAVYLREPLLAMDFRAPMEEYLTTYLYANRLVLRGIIGEIFTEEGRRITAVYEGILKAIASGKRKSGEISSFLFSRKLIPKDNPGAIQRHLDVLVHLGLIERIETEKRGFYYAHTSPLFNIHFYLDEKYGYVETDVPRDYIRRVVEEMLPRDVENFVWNLLAKKLGLKKIKIEDPELDIALKRFNRLAVVGEVKWKRNITDGYIEKIAEKLRGYNALRLIILPDKSGLSERDDVILLDAKDLVELCTGRFKLIV